VTLAQFLVNRAETRQFTIIDSKVTPDELAAHDPKYLYFDGPLYEELAQATVYSLDGGNLGTLRDVLGRGLEQAIPVEGSKFLPLRGAIHGDPETYWGQLLMRQEAFNGLVHEALDVLLFLGPDETPYTTPVGTAIRAIFPGTYGWVFDDFMQVWGTAVTRLRIFVRIRNDIWQAIAVETHAHRDDPSQIRVGQEVAAGEATGTVQEPQNPYSLVTAHWHFGFGLKKLGPADEVLSLIEAGNELAIGRDDEMTYDAWNELARQGEIVYLNYAKLISPEQRRKLFIERTQDGPVLVHLGLQSLLMIGDSQWARRSFARVARSVPGTYVSNPKLEEIRAAGGLAEMLEVEKAADRWDVILSGNEDQWSLTLNRPGSVTSVEGQGIQALLDEVNRIAAEGRSSSDTWHGVIDRPADTGEQQTRLIEKIQRIPLPYKLARQREWSQLQVAIRQRSRQHPNSLMQSIVSGQDFQSLRKGPRPSARIQLKHLPS